MPQITETELLQQIAQLEDKVNAIQAARFSLSEEQAALQQQISTLESDLEARRVASRLSPGVVASLQRMLAAPVESGEQVGQPGAAN
jgi:septal ring factor EnvC (AmiA/AmiB activator)